MSLPFQSQDPIHRNGQAKILSNYHKKPEQSHWCLNTVNQWLEQRLRQCCQGCAGAQLGPEKSSLLHTAGKPLLHTAPAQGRQVLLTHLLHKKKPLELVKRLSTRILSPGNQLQTLDSCQHVSGWPGYAGTDLTHSPSSN